jgi:hypothetical protein
MAQHEAGAAERERREAERAVDAERLKADRARLGKKVPCPGCGRRFVTEADRDSHMRAVHPDLEAAGQSG